MGNITTQYQTQTENRDDSSYRLSSEMNVFLFFRRLMAAIELGTIRALSSQGPSNVLDMEQVVSGREICRV